MVYQRISHGEPVRHIVDASPTPQVYDEQAELEKEKAWAKKMRESLKVTEVHVGKSNEELDPNEERRLAAEHAIEYSDVEDCPFCKEQIVYRASSTIWSPTRGTDKSVLTDHSYPDYVPIDVKTIGRDRWNNHQDLFGKYQPHRCNTDQMSKEELARYVEHLNKQSIEFDKWIFQKLRYLEKVMVTRPVYRID